VHQIDTRLAEILATRTCPALPTDVIQPAYRLARLLLASRAWSDVAVFTRVSLLEDGRYVAPVHGKWGITFTWIPDAGPTDLALARF